MIACKCRLLENAGFGRDPDCFECADECPDCLPGSQCLACADCDRFHTDRDTRLENR